MARWAYAWYWPNGELSHYHWRIQLAAVDPDTGKPRKRYLYQSPGGQWSLPATYYPLYGDMGIPVGAHIVIVEGEPATDAINSRQLLHAGSPVHAVTAGSAQDTIAASPILQARLKELAPASLTLWPDADETGVKAMAELRKKLQQDHLPAALVDPGKLGMAAKEDAVEFLQRGGDISLLLAALTRPAAAVRPTDVASQITVLRDGMLWPGTQTVVKIDHSMCSAAWQQITSTMPTDRQAKELYNVLQGRRAASPVEAYWRIRAEPHHTTWRSAPMQDCYRLSAAGIDVIADVDSGTLLAPGHSVVPSEVDLSADGESYFHQLCDLFGLSGLERTLVLVWWICRLMGRETPIILMKGESGSGKSTLASFILGLVEPTLREVQVPDQRAWSDERQLIRTLQQVPAVTVDNVTALSGAMEDTLSKLVTGYNNSVMWKYSNDVDQVRIRRGVIITTTTYEVYKGDLATRIIVVTPRLVDRIDRDTVDSRYMPWLPAIRGWVFKLVCRVYANPVADGAFRVASVGSVLASLGYDPAALAAQEAHARAAIISQNDQWLMALVDIWERKNDGGEFLLSLTQIVDEMRAYGVPLDMLPSTGGPKFARWVEEKNMILRDHGFTLHRHRDEKGRGYWFRRNRTA